MVAFQSFKDGLGREPLMNKQGKRRHIERQAFSFA